MKILAGIWVACLVTGCVFVYLLGAVEEIVTGWRASAAGRRRV